jgi:hypothetical protein
MLMTWSKKYTTKGGKSCEPEDQLQLKSTSTNSIPHVYK